MHRLSRSRHGIRFPRIRLGPFWLSLRLNFNHGPHHALHAPHLKLKQPQSLHHPHGLLPHPCSAPRDPPAVNLKQKEKSRDILAKLTSTAPRTACSPCPSRPRCSSPSARTTPGSRSTADTTTGGWDKTRFREITGPQARTSYPSATAATTTSNFFIPS